jgi:peptidoglycan/xylan/chitin deacetylase (PgdA/CDA1 family)
MKHDHSLPQQMSARLDESELAIFLFHGVVTKPAQGIRNYTGKHISSELFARCIAQISLVGHALSMDEVLHHCETRTPFPSKAFAITFDDGFENNLSVAAPILDDFDVPATIYVTTELIETNGMSWIDRIELAVERTPVKVISPPWSDEKFGLRDEGSKIRFLQAVRKYVKSSPNCDANAFADDLCVQLSADRRPEAYGELDLKMSWQQVRAAGESSLLTIGGHSHTHSILSFLAPQQLEAELDTCFYFLETKGGIKPIHFSYPEGLKYCYSENVIQALKRRQVRCCPTAIDGRNAIGDDPFHLNRIMVG